MSTPAAARFPSGDFTRFWWGEAVSSFGTYVTLLALQTLVVLTLDGDAQDVGWLNSARWLPYLVLGLVVGALVDRYRRRPVMVATDLARSVLLLLIPAAWAADVLTLPLLLVVVALYGSASLVNDAASMSFLPRLVPHEHLPRAHARIDGADAVAQTAGPALAGLLVRLVGAPLAVLVDALSYLVSAFAVLGLRTEEPRPEPSETPNIRREIAEGVRWVYRGSGLAALAASTHVWFAANAVLGAVVAPYALLTLGLTPLQLGLAVAMAGVGGVVGASTTSAGGRRLGMGGAVILAHVVTTIGVVVTVLAGLGTSGWVATAVLGLGQACHGFGIGFSNAHETTYRQVITPDALQARTNTTMKSFNRAVIVVVAPLGGLLAVQAGHRVRPGGGRRRLRAVRRDGGPLAVPERALRPGDGRPSYCSDDRVTVVRARPHLRRGGGGLRALPARLPARGRRRGAGHARLPLRRAVEIGAGTGKATRVFTAAGLAVTAIEPDPAMLSRARPARDRRRRAGAQHVRGPRPDRAARAGRPGRPGLRRRPPSTGPTPAPGGPGSPRCSVRTASWRQLRRGAGPGRRGTARPGARGRRAVRRRRRPPDPRPVARTRPCCWPGTEMRDAAAFTDVRQVRPRAAPGHDGRRLRRPPLDTVSAYLLLPPAPARRGPRCRSGTCCRTTSTSSPTWRCTSRDRR